MMNLLKYQFYKLLLAGSLLLTPASVKAQIGLPEELRPEYLPDIGRGSTAEEKIYAVVGDTLIVAMQVVGGVAIIIIIIAGLRYTLSGGEDDNITKAKSTLTWTIGGLVLLFLVLAIIRFVIKLTLAAEEL